MKEVIFYLGVKIYYNQKQITNYNFEPLLQKVKNKFNLWLSRDLSMYGQVLFIKKQRFIKAHLPNSGAG